MSGPEAVTYKKAQKLEQVETVMNPEEDELQTHFVENPFIKSREKASRKEGLG